MSQVEVTRLVPKLRYNLKDRRKLSNPQGPQGRHDKIRKTVTALFKFERIELNYHHADESRGYAERLISDAIKYGDCHKETMKMASYWILEKQIVHKLFKVLVPRYQSLPTSYTRMWKLAPFNEKENYSRPKCVLELRNNIYPSLSPDKSNHKNLLHNVLLNEAKKEYEKRKAIKLLEENGASLVDVKRVINKFNEKLIINDVNESLNKKEHSSMGDNLKVKDSGKSDNEEDKSTEFSFSESEASKEKKTVNSKNSVKTDDLSNVKK